MAKSITTKNDQETKAFAAQIAKSLVGGEVLLLHGDLGSGKTTFTQGLAEGLGIKKHINSPTFIIMRTYSLPEKKKATNLYHIDLYRTESKSDIEGLGLAEIIGNKENIVVIEWPEKLGSNIPKKAQSLNFKFINENTREITRG